MQKALFYILREKIAGTFAETKGPKSIRNAVVIKYLQRKTFVRITAYQKCGFPFLLKCHNVPSICHT